MREQGVEPTRLGSVRPVPDQQSPPPGSTPAAVVSLLVHQVLGPLRRDRVRMVLDYHGLAGRPTGTLAAVAARNHVTPPTVSKHVHQVRVAAAGLTLPAELIRGRHPPFPAG